MFSSIGKFILNIVENGMHITNNEIWDTLIFMGIGAIAYIIAYAKVGDLASFFDFNAGLMRLLHWTLRIFLFWLIANILMFVVGLIKWLLSFAWWVYLLIGGIVALIAMIVIILKAIGRKNYG